MTKTMVAWSVRGVGRETRLLAKNAARKRRVTTGEWVSLALITVAEEELMVSPKSLLPLGPSPIASSVADEAIEAMSARERALLALASKRPPPKGRAEQEQQSPWSVRGVSQVARVKAAQAAAHRRVTIGEWVNHAISVYAGQDTGVDGAPAKATGKPGGPGDVPEKTLRLVETLARHFDDSRTTDIPDPTVPDVERVFDRLDKPASPSASGDDADALAAAAEKKITELAEQVRQSEQRNEKRLSALTGVLSTVADRLQKDHQRPLQAIAPTPPPETHESEDKLSKAEMVFWDSIKDSNDIDAYEAYLETFPDGLFAPLAKKRAARAADADNGAPTAPAEPIESTRPLRRRPPPAHSLPVFDYETLNEKAIENTKRRT